jgi:hypothetical protein
MPMKNKTRPILANFETDISDSQLYPSPLFDEFSTLDPIFKGTLLPRDASVFNIQVGTKITRVLQETTDDE